MNGRDDEAWLDSMLQRSLPSGLPGDGFPKRVLRRLPRRERPLLRLFLLGLTYVVAAAVLVTLVPPASVLSSLGGAGLSVPFSLGTVLLWYIADSLM